MRAAFTVAGKIEATKAEAEELVKKLPTRRSKTNERIFVVGEKKERPGVYKRYENAGGVEAAGARSGVGCALVTGNWGALNTPVTIDQSTDISSVIGAGSGHDAITAFMAGGMEECVVVRVGTGGTPATITLKDTTASTAVDAVVYSTLSGKQSIYHYRKGFLDDEQQQRGNHLRGNKSP